MKDKSNILWKENKNNTLSFFIPFLILMLAYMAMGITPFGEFSLIVSDMQGQYIDMFSAYRDVMQGNRSILYTWSQIQGSNMFVILIPYILSPFNVIAAILPEENLADAITLITLIKVGCAGLSCSWYLRKSHNKKDISIVAFACCYALMGYSIIFSMNIFWLDLIILLPFVIWGVDLILKDEKKYLFFTISLIIIFCLNYYLAYMVGIFSFLYFIYKYLCIYETSTIKFFLKKLISFLGSSILAALCSACILLPNYYSLGLNTRQGFFEPTKFKIALEYDLFTIFTKLFIGSYDTIKYGGVANLYCGLIITILLLFYFVNKKIKFREKLLTFLMLVFFWLSCTISILYIGWHLFASPHFFEARFSFAICFFMIIIGYTSYAKIESISIKNINNVFLGIASVVLLIDRMNYNYITDTVVISTVVFLILYYLFFVVMEKKEQAKKYYKLIFVTLICTELCLNTNITILSMDDMLHYPSKYDYYQERDRLKKQIDEIMNEDSDFYRIDKNFARSDDDGINIGYPCISMFASSYNQETKDQMERLGIKTGHNWVVYEGFTKVTDAIFNLKYIILQDETMPSYDQISKKYDRIIYKNPYALSIGYMVNKDLNGVDEQEDSKIYNPFLYQNKLLGEMIGGNNVHYFKPVDAKVSNFENMASKEIEMKDPDSNDPLQMDMIDITYYYKKDIIQEGYIEYEIEAQQGPLYLYLPTKDVRQILVKVGDKEERPYFDLLSNHIIYLGEYKSGEKVKVRIQPAENEMYLQDVQFYHLDTQLFQEAVDMLANNQLIIESYSDSSVEGSITVEDRHILFTSIPYDEGWHIKVNGIESKPIKVMNGFIGLELSNPGTYHLEFNYMPKGLIIGLIISGIGFLMLFVIGLVIRIKLKRSSANSEKDVTNTTVNNEV